MMPGGGGECLTVGLALAFAGDHGSPLRGGVNALGWFGMGGAGDRGSPLRGGVNALGWFGMGGRAIADRPYGMMDTSPSAPCAPPLSTTLTASGG